MHDRHRSVADERRSDPPLPSLITDESENAMNIVKTTLIAAALFSAGAVLAQPAPGAHARHQPGERIVQLLNLDATRAAQVTTIMTDAKTQRKAVWESMQGKRGDASARDAARAQMKAINEGTQAKLSQVLTADEMTKLKDARGHGRRHSGFGPGPAKS